MVDQKKLLIHDLIVVAFDMCSSSNVIEDLTLTGNISRYEHFLTTIKRWLMQQTESTEFNIYKFTGDGWILLFPIHIEGRVLASFLSALCNNFKREFMKQIAPFLENPPDVTGITIGVDKGPLVKMIMLQRAEFVGRAINIACRLQSAVGDKGGPPAYKALISNQVYNEYLRGHHNFKVWKADRTLKNIRAGARYKCHKINFMQKQAA